jgi:hypothetical protein
MNDQIKAKKQGASLIKNTFKPCKRKRELDSASSSSVPSLQLFKSNAGRGTELTQHSSSPLKTPETIRMESLANEEVSEFMITVFGKFQNPPPICIKFNLQLFRGRKSE